MLAEGETMYIIKLELRRHPQRPFPRPRNQHVSSLSLSTSSTEFAVKTQCYWYSAGSLFTYLARGGKTLPVISFGDRAGIEVLINRLLETARGVGLRKGGIAIISSGTATVSALKCLDEVSSFAKVDQGIGSDPGNQSAVARADTRQLIYSYVI
ncbi:hypothetical protein BD779DRAFT_1787399 [Infundibulicybe gibba]|nr:hypothetical protein BD779DRAFT_1787399 [Infundibulicybe gibba]